MTTLTVRREGPFSSFSPCKTRKSRIVLGSGVHSASRLSSAKNNQRLTGIVHNEQDPASPSDAVPTEWAQGGGTSLRTNGRSSGLDRSTRVALNRDPLIRDWDSAVS